MNILFVHHHKTGHVLSRDIAKLINKAKDKTLNIVSNPKQKRSYQLTDLGFRFEKIHFDPDRDNLYVQASPYHVHHDQDLRVVHFIRDPYDMCVSSYLYHRQDPTPEEWVHDVHPMRYDSHILRHMLESIGLSGDEVVDLISQGQALLHDRWSYYDHLRQLPTMEGLLLESIRFTISADPYAGSDIIRMPYLANKLKQSTIPYAQVYMHELNGTPESKRTALQRVVDVSGLQDISVERLCKKLIKKQEEAKANSNHVTRHHITSEERDSMMAFLKGQDVLGKVLKTAKDTLQYEAL